MLACTKYSFVFVRGISFCFHFLCMSFSGDDVVIDTSGLDDILNKLDEVVTGKLAQVDENKCTDDSQIEHTECTEISKYVVQNCTD